MALIKHIPSSTSFGTISTYSTTQTINTEIGKHFAIFDLAGTTVSGATEVDHTSIHVSSSNGNIKVIEATSNTVVITSSYQFAVLPLD